MKKMYKQPESQIEELILGSVILTGSTVVNNNALSGGDGGSGSTIPTVD